MVIFSYEGLSETLGGKLDFNFKPINKLMVNGICLMAIGFITEMRQVQDILFQPLGRSKRIVFG
jgi:hypothetical protein